jgi:hypothetical protein
MPTKGMMRAKWNASVLIASTCLVAACQDGAGTPSGEATVIPPSPTASESARATTAASSPEVSTGSKYPASRIKDRFMPDVEEMVGRNAKVLERSDVEVTAIGVRACELLDEHNRPHVVVRLIAQRDRLQLDEAIAVTTSAVTNICPKYMKDLGD